MPYDLSRGDAQPVEHYPNDVMRVNYEELCHRLRVQTDSVTSFPGLAPGDESFQQHAKQTLKSTHLKKPFRLNTLIDEPFLQTILQLGYEV